MNRMKIGQGQVYIKSFIQRLDEPLIMKLTPIVSISGISSGINIM